MIMRALAFCFVALLAGALPAAASERILSFDSDIVIARDASITVTETIKINAEGSSIRRGIIREFPTKYKDERGDTIEVGFELLSVTRDGKPEQNQVDGVSNGVEIRIGDPDVLISRGEHTYVIKYRTTFQLGFFPEGDELYYNVTGHGWIYPIDKASATVHLPEGAKATRLDIFTGEYGSTGKNGTISEAAPGLVTARTTAPLGVYEGLTIAVQWPKGFVDEPSGAAYLWRWLWGNLAALVGLIGAGITGAVLYLSWRRWGKDPERGTIIPLFEPPGGMEPAETRFLSEMGFDNKVFAASVVDMAVKGALTIEEDPGWFSKTYKLVRTGDGSSALSPVERLAYDQLFASGDTIELKQENWQRIKAAVDAMKGSLQLRHVGKTFHENQGAIGVAIAVLVGTGLLIWATANGGVAPWVGGAAVAGGVVLVGLFINLMKAPTVEGQVLRDRIDGFKMFLDTAEKERWEVLNPPDMTPQLFEKYLPFALALDVDHTWSETFEREMRIREPGGNYEYRPRWYSGRSFSGIGAGALTNSISTAMTSAIASSSSPPGKKSGFGGGGFSGGGGGGGGGRGW